MIKFKVMNLLHFIKQFLDEVSCKAHMMEVRSKEGIVCKKSVNQRSVLLWESGKTKTSKKSKHERYFKMKVLDTHKKEEINNGIKVCNQLF